MHAMRADRAVLASGEVLRVDAVLVDMYVEPCASIVPASLRGASGGIKADRHMQVTDDFSAAADVAEAKGRRVEHYSEAIEQGMFAGWNMTGEQRRRALGSSSGRGSSINRWPRAASRPRTRAPCSTVIS